MLLEFHLSTFFFLFKVARWYKNFSKKLKFQQKIIISFFLYKNYTVSYYFMIQYKNQSKNQFGLIHNDFQNDYIIQKAPHHLCLVQ